MINPRAPYILLFVFSLLGSGLFSQVNYYVDATSGNDTYTGLSLAQAWKTIQKACNSVPANSVVQIKGGTYHENLVVNVSGTSGNPIVFRNYQNDSVFIDGAGTAGTILLQITDKNYLTFENMVFQNLTLNGAQGILAESTVAGTSTGLVFRKLVIRHINWTASAASIPTSNDNAQALIVYGRDNGLTNLVIDSCRVYSNILGFSEAVSIDGNVSGFQVSGCQVHDNTNIGILAAGNYGTCSVPANDHARNGLIYQNTCSKNVSAYATSAGIYVDGGRSVVVYRNSCSQNGSGIELGCEQSGTTDSITVKNNLVFNNQYTGLAIGGYDVNTTGQVLNSVVRNNSFFNNNSPTNNSGEIDMTKASNCVIENNVFYTSSSNTLFTVENISPQTNNTIDYNCWYTPANDTGSLTVNWRSGGYSTFDTYRSGTGMDAHSFYGNPLLNNAVLPAPDLHLLNASPCVNKGNPLTTSSSGETDYDGNIRIAGGRIDMGAYEFSPVSGVFEKKFSVSFTVYPNPAADYLFFRTDVTVTGAEVLDTRGKVLFSQKPALNCISLSGLSSGVYLLRLVSEEGLSGEAYFVRF